mmetsp:Transcript_11843/g.35577  ORF Transcript_11843/g.35577 Transcript_11843/m.35577 type:complete len:253 (-) Transcript_11843:2417-3175(-)
MMKQALPGRWWSVVVQTPTDMRKSGCSSRREEKLEERKRNYDAKAMRGSPSLAGTSAPMVRASGSAARAAVAWAFSTTRTRPMPQLKVRSMSSSGSGPARPWSQRKSGGKGLTAGASRLAARLSGSTRGRFSRRPPPVMWAAPSRPQRSTRWMGLAYSAVGASKASASVVFFSGVASAAAKKSAAGRRRASGRPPGTWGATASARSLRTRLKPLAWRPVDGRASKTSPTVMVASLGSKSPRRTAPTQKPATS